MTVSLLLIHSPSAAVDRRRHTTWNRSSWSLCPRRLPLLLHYFWKRKRSNVATRGPSNCESSSNEVYNLFSTWYFGVSLVFPAAMNPIRENAISIAGRAPLVLPRSSCDKVQGVPPQIWRRSAEYNLKCRTVTVLSEAVVLFPSRIWATLP